MYKKNQASDPNLTQRDWGLIGYIQGDLPAGERPFLTLAQKLGWTEDEVIDRIKGWMVQGIIKRFGALVRHHELGFKGNAMVAWEVPEEKIEEVGSRMAGYAFISHCYERVKTLRWPYNIYTMIHAPTKDETRTLVYKVSKDTGITSFRILFTVKEWKKKSMEYR